MKKTLIFLFVAFIAMNMAYSQTFYYGWEGKKVPLLIAKNGFLVEFSDENQALVAMKSYQTQKTTAKTEIVKVGNQVFLQLLNVESTTAIPNELQSFKTTVKNISPLYLLPSDKQPFYFTNVPYALALRLNNFTFFKTIQQ